MSSSIKNMGLNKPNTLMIDDSLPPHLKGANIGSLIIRINKLKFNDKPSVASHQVKFSWWGMTGKEFILNIPWKAGYYDGSIAIFPLRADKKEIQQYFVDMSQLNMFVLDSDHKLVGQGSLNLNSIVNNLEFSDSIKIFGKSNKKTIGELFFDLSTTFELVEPTLPTSANLKVPNKMTKKPSVGSVMDSFQRNEVIIPIVY